MFRILRISVLLYVLLIVAMTTWSARTRNTDWKEPLWVALYPINGDASDRSNDYIETLSEAAFQPLEAVMAKQAKNWGVPLEKPIDIKFAPEIASLPPPPADDTEPTRGRLLESATAAVGVASRHLRRTFRHSHICGVP